MNPTRPTGKTRRAVIDALNANGPSSTLTLATHFGVTTVAVLSHLVALEKAGLVSRVGRGCMTRWQIGTAVTVDDGSVLAYLAANRGLRRITEIVKGTGLARPVVIATLTGLVNAGKVSTGLHRGTTLYRRSATEMLRLTG